MIKSETVAKRNRTTFPCLMIHKHTSAIVLFQVAHKGMVLVGEVVEDILEPKRSISAGGIFTRLSMDDFEFYQGKVILYNE